MNCTNCGTYNNPQSKFCVKCGSALNGDNLGQPMQNVNPNLNEQPTMQSTGFAQNINSNPNVQPTMQPNEFFQNVNPTPNEQPTMQSTGFAQNISPNLNEQPTMQPTGFAQNVNPTSNYQQAMQPQMQESINNIQVSQPSEINQSPLNYIMYLLTILINPFKCYKEEESKLNNAKTSIILSLIVIIVMTLSTVVQTIISTVRVASFSLTDGFTYTWQWDNIKNIKWFEVIDKNLLIYVGIILAITVVFYLGSLVIKRKLNFFKVLSITASSMIPAVCGIMILSPILGMIWSPLSIVFIIIGLLYSLLILYELINSELNLEKSMKIYFYLVCFGILIIAGYYVYMKLFTSTITDGLDNILDLLE